MNKQKISTTVLYGYMAGMLLAGSANTILLKTMNVQTAEYTDPKTKQVKEGNFNHPFFQTALMFLGELCVFFVYFSSQLVKRKLRAIKPEAEPKPQPKYNPFLLAIPAACDFFGSTTMFFSLLMIDASVFQMQRGSIIIITAGLAVCFLKRKQYRHHVTSLIVLFLGLLLIGVASVQSSGDDAISNHSATSNIIGIILLAVSQLFFGAFYIFEEKLLSSYQLHPMVVVGWEGFFGFSICLVALPILQTISCTADADTGFCTYHTLENSNVAFRQMSENGVILGCSIGVILSIAFFNIFGVSVTKYASSPQRATIGTSRTVVIWVFFLTVPIEGAEETFHWLQLIGFILLVIGTLVYNEILVIHYLGFDRWTKAAIEKRAKEKENSQKNPVIMEKQKVSQEDAKDEEQSPSDIKLEQLKEEEEEETQIKEANVGE